MEKLLGEIPSCDSDISIVQRVTLIDDPKEGAITREGRFCCQPEGEQWYNLSFANRHNTQLQSQVLLVLKNHLQHQSLYISP